MISALGAGFLSPENTVEPHAQARIALDPNWVTTEGLQP